MDYEKKYKDALERMKSWAKGEHPECFSEAQKTAEFIFPELKESEEERIIKNIKLALISMEDNLSHFYSTHHTSQKELLIWLEKQGEQKTVNMSIKKKAHQIAWESSKHYDPNVCKQEWCEMSALEMASWLENLQKSYKNGID